MSEGGKDIGKGRGGTGGGGGGGGGWRWRGQSPHVHYNVPFNHFRKIKFDRLTDGLQCSSMQPWKWHTSIVS